MAVAVREQLEVRACSAKVSTPAQITASDPWREAAFHPLPVVHTGLCTLRCFLVLPRGLEGLVWWGVHRHLAHSRGGRSISKS